MATSWGDGSDGDVMGQPCAPEALLSCGKTNKKEVFGMEKTKKRSFLIALVCCLALAASIALVGCGGGGSNQASSGGSSSGASTGSQPEDTKADFVWFKADAPEGYTVSCYSTSGKATSPAFASEGDSSTKIQLGSNYKLSASEAAEDQVDSEKYTQGEDITINGRTYNVVNFTWDRDTPSVMLYTDVDGTENQSVKITAFMLTPDDETLTSFLESLEFAEDIDEAYDEAAATKLDDIKAKYDLK